ncbi:MAG TPA: ABC transporter permease subunit [Candidatus Limnocylindrales bacterium]|nr:ABC transporter permease subunit [Candidatus Limnocylindrales bacterium]
MTVTTASPSDPIARRGGVSAMLAGIRPLFKKDIREWRHGVRIWVVLVVTALFMCLAAANGWIQTWVIANVPEAAASADKVISMAPMDNLLIAAGSQIFVIAAIFASMSLLVSERDRGTLAWVASKPVSRTSIWISKFASATVVLWVVAGIVPIALTGIVLAVLYGAPSITGLVLIALGIGAAIALFVAVVLAASTLAPSQPAVAAIAFAVFFLPSILGAIVPFAIQPFFPTSILDWAAGLAIGANVGFVTPIAWLVAIVALAAFSARRMERLDL